MKRENPMFRGNSTVLEFGIGAGDGDRTRDVQLGKLTFYH